MLASAAGSQEWPTTSGTEWDLGFGALTAGPLEILQVIFTSLGSGAAVSCVALLPAKFGWLSFERATTALQTGDLTAPAGWWRLALLSLYCALAMLLVHLPIAHLSWLGAAACAKRFYSDYDHPHLRHAATLLTGCAGLGLVWVVWESHVLVTALLGLPLWQYACVGGGGLFLCLLAFAVPGISFGFAGRYFVVRTYRRLGLLHSAAAGYERLARNLSGAQREECLRQAVACYDRLNDYGRAGQICEQLAAYREAAERYLLAAGLRPDDVLG